MPYEITVGTSRSTGPFQKRGFLSRLKTIVLAFLFLSLAAGVVMAALLLGLAVAGLLVMGIVATIAGMMVSRMWRRRA